mgnify:FL=1
MPLVVLVGCRAAHVGQLATGVAVVLAGMPMGGTTTILAEKYGADSTFASKCTAISTVLLTAGPCRETGSEPSFTWSPGIIWAFILKKFVIRAKKCGN